MPHGERINKVTAKTLADAFQNEFPNQPHAYWFDKELVKSIMRGNECKNLKIFFGFDDGILKLILTPADGVGNRLKRNPPAGIVIHALEADDGDFADKGGTPPPPVNDL